MHGGHAEREIGVVSPVLLRYHACGEVVGMGVRVDVARHDGLAGRVDHLGIGRNGDTAAGADGLDLVAIDDQGAVLDHVLGAGIGIAHRDQARVGERKYVSRLVHRQGKADIDWPQRIALGIAAQESNGVLQRDGVVVAANHPVQALRIGRPMQVGANVLADCSDRNCLAVLGQFNAATGGGQRRDVGVEEFGEGDPLAIRTDADEVDVFEVEHFARLFAIEADTHQFLLEATASEVVDASSVSGKLWIAAGLGDASANAAIRIHQVDAGLAVVELAGQ